MTGLTAGETSLLWSLGYRDVASIIDRPDYYIASCRDGHRSGGDYFFHHAWEARAVSGVWMAPADPTDRYITGPGYGDTDRCGGRDCLRIHTGYGSWQCQPGKHFQHYPERIELSRERITYTRLTKWANSIDPKLRAAVRDAGDWQAEWWAVRAILGPRDWMYRYRDHYLTEPSGISGKLPLACTDRLDGDQYALFEMAS